MYYRITYIHKGETKENPLYIPGDQDYCLVTAKLTLAMGKAGDLTVDIPTTNPAYDDIVCLTDEIIVYEGDDEIWRGRSTTLQTDFDRTGTLDCEGVLSYLYDTYFPPFDFSGSPKTLLQQVIDNHNKCVGSDSEKYIELGDVTVEDPNDYIARSSIDYNRSLEILQDKFVNESLGGFFRIRMENGAKKLDYLENYAQGSVASQEIRYAENLLDIAQEVQYTDTASAILPLGAKIEDEDGMQTDEYTTIAPVNSGSVYWQDDAAVASYGWICVCVVWDDVTDPSNLLSRAKTYLAQVSNAVQYFSVNAVDLSKTTDSEKPWRIGDMIRLYSRPHNLNQYAELSEMDLDLLSPDNNTYTFGSDTVSMTGSARNSARDLQTSMGELSVRMDNLSVNVINAVYGNIEHIVSDTIDTNYIYAILGEFDTVQTEGILSEWGIIENFQSVTANINELYTNYQSVSGLLEATAIEVGSLNAITEQVVTLLGGDITAGEITSIYLAAGTTVIETAVIENALLDTVLADIISSNVIYTDYIKIMDNEGGNLIINGSTLQMSDGTTIRIQMGLDAYGNYNYYLADENGNIIWDAAGLTEAGLIGNGAIIRDIAIADDAAIQGSKLDIASVASCLNADGSLILQASQVYLGDEGLSIVIATMQDEIDNLDPSQWERYGIYDVIEWYCTTDEILDEEGEGTGEYPEPSEPYDDRAYAEVFALGLSVLGNTENSSGWTTEQPDDEEGKCIWTCNEYLRYNDSPIWTTPKRLTDTYARSMTSTFIQEFKVMDGIVESLTGRVDNIDGEISGIQSDFNYFYQDYEKTINQISSDVVLATDDASAALSQVDTLVVTVEGLSNTVTNSLEILVPGYEYLESNVSWLIQNNEEISQGLVHVEQLIDDLDTDGLRNFEAYYILSDDPDTPPDTPRYDDRAYAMIFALGVSVLGNVDNSCEWTTEKLTGAEGLNLLNFYEGLNADAVYEAEETYLYMNAYGLQYAPGRTVTLSFEWQGDSNLIIVTRDGQWEISESNYSWTTATFTFEVSPGYEGGEEDPIVVIQDPDSSHELRHIKLELGSEATDFNTGTSLKYVWMSWRKIHTDGTVTWSEPELLTDAYTNVQWSYIHETLSGITMEVGKIDDLSIQVSTLEMTVEGITTTVTNMTDPNNPDSLVYQMSEIDQKADSISSRVTSIENDYTTSSDLTQMADSITGTVYAWEEDLYGMIQVDLKSATMQVYSGVDGGAIMKIQVGESDEMYGRNLLKDTTYHEEITSKTYTLTDFAVENGSNQTVCLRFKARGEGTLTVTYSRNGSSSSEETWMTEKLPLENFTDDEGELVVLNLDPDTWAFFECQRTPWTAPSSGGYIKFSLTGSVTFAEVKLEFLDPDSERNSHGTSWTPAPEDDMTEFALDVRQYFANSNSIAYVAAGQIWFIGGTIGIDTNNFTLDTEGDMWARNAYLNNVAVTGQFSSWEDDSVFSGVGVVINGNDLGYSGNVGAIEFVYAPSASSTWQLLGELTHQTFEDSTGGGSNGWGGINLFCYNDDFVAIGDDRQWQYVMSKHGEFWLNASSHIEARHMFWGKMWIEDNLTVYNGYIDVTGGGIALRNGYGVYHYDTNGDRIQMEWMGSDDCFYIGGVNNASTRDYYRIYIRGNPTYIAGAVEMYDNLTVDGDIYGSYFSGTANYAYSADYAASADYASRLYDGSSNFAHKSSNTVYIGQDLSSSQTNIFGGGVQVGGTACSFVGLVADSIGIGDYSDHNVKTVNIYASTEIRIGSQSSSYGACSDIYYGASGVTQHIRGSTIYIGAQSSAASTINIGYPSSDGTIALQSRTNVLNNIYMNSGYSFYLNNIQFLWNSGTAIGVGPSARGNPLCLWGSDVQINGTNIVWNGSTWTNSDRSLKGDIKQLDKDEESEETLLDELDKLEPVQFTMNEETDGRIHYGYIADDVEEVMPELVYTHDDGVRALGYTQIIPLLHLKIKSQDAEIADLKSRIAELESALPKSK